MHNFSELLYRSSIFIKSVFENSTHEILKELEKSGATVHIKNLQMINLQKTFFVIGAFSYFEALIQNNLNCKNGFEEAKNILKNNSEIVLLEKFEEAQDIINVLKHGRGRSYEKLLNKTKAKN